MTLRQKTPMKRSTPLRQHKPMARMSSPARRKRPKKRPGHDKAMIEAVRGQPCYLQVDGVCMGDRGIETVVPCHANTLALGKGMGLKVPDKFTVPGCFACHAWLDTSGADKALKQSVWEFAYRRWSAYRDSK